MKILLTTLHAKYSHSSLALPSLAASCANISNISIKIQELTINEQHGHLLRQLISEHANLIAFSCYIWNIEQTLRLVSDIKKISPETTIVLGGPEVSFSVFELMAKNPEVDYVVKGEGEKTFRLLIETLKDNNLKLLDTIPNLFYRQEETICTGVGDDGYLKLDELPSPFQQDLVNLEKPLIYYETSRGCPFSCAFCLSSTETAVRSYSKDRMESDLFYLMQHKADTIKFVDRTFNYNPKRANSIWSYILEHNRSSHFHFEIAADLLTDENIEILRHVPPDTFQFEIGIQSTFADTLKQVNRASDLESSYEAIRRLRSETNINLHLDLVAGLPGENYDQFLQSLDILIALEPHQIQVEPLKILKGSKMREIAAIENYRYSQHPPYTILKNRWLSFNDICRIETVGKLLDLFYNQSRFPSTLRFLACRTKLSSLFSYIAYNWGNQPLHGLSTLRQFELFFQLVSTILQENDLPNFADVLFFDYCNQEIPRAGKLPAFIDQKKSCCHWSPGSKKDILANISIPEGSKVTLFYFTFLQNYGNSTPDSKNYETVFAYISTPGAGLKILEL